MKITINKTRSKDSKTSVSKSGTGSPKTHTGLKPGVNSGPASKKPQHLGQKVSVDFFVGLKLDCPVSYSVSTLLVAKAACKSGASFYTLANFGCLKV